MKSCIGYFKQILQLLYLHISEQHNCFIKHCKNESVISTMQIVIYLPYYHAKNSLYPIYIDLGSLIHLMHDCSHIN